MARYRFAGIGSRPLPEVPRRGPIASSGSAPLDRHRRHRARSATRQGRPARSPGHAPARMHRRLQADVVCPAVAVPV